jgi:hypothetical protein
MGLDLPFTKPSGKSWLTALVLGLLLAVLLVDGFSLGHLVIYGAHRQTFHNEKELKVLFTSPNQE